MKGLLLGTFDPGSCPGFLGYADGLSRAATEI